MKERINVSIDSEVLKKGKKIIPNLSEFVEECIKKRIGWGEDAIFPVHSAHEELENIGTSMANLHLMTEKQNIQDKEDELQEQKKDQVWRKIFAEYKNQNQNIDTIQLHEASELLEVSAEVLSDTLYVASEHVPLDKQFKCNNFKWCYEHYLAYLESVKK